MVSTRPSSRAELVASNAQARADGGCIFADAPNAATSAAVMLHHISMHRNTTRLRVTRSSRASSRASDGFTTIVPESSSTARSSTPLTRIRWINRCPDRPKRCLQTGKRCFTNRGGSLVLMSATGARRDPGRTISRCSASGLGLWPIGDLQRCPAVCALFGDERISGAPEPGA